MNVGPHFSDSQEGYYWSFSPTSFGEVELPELGDEIFTDEVSAFLLRQAYMHHPRLELAFCVV